MKPHGLPRKSSCTCTRCRAIEGHLTGHAKARRADAREVAEQLVEVTGPHADGCDDVLGCDVLGCCVDIACPACGFDITAGCCCATNGARVTLGDLARAA